MKSLADIKNILTRNKQQLYDKYGVMALAVFGSYGRGQQREDSDVDILVEFKKPIGLEFIDLATELEKILNKKVDLVSKNGIKAQYMREIEQDINYV
ncbi:MAG: nucleotidyltransferase family protein [Bacteroidetes bacterium]|nr:nucleotidyltransferase family protein [Bacteroidota bacterium]